MYSSVSENWPTAEPYFIETGLHCPTSFPADRLEQLVEFCVRTVQTLGLSLGVLHVEGKYTSNGPRVLEVNARMGGTTVRNLNLFVHGVDLVEEHMIASLGVPIRPLKAPQPLCGVSEVLLQADRTGSIPSTDFLDPIKSDPRVFYFDSGIAPGDTVLGAADGFPTVVADFGLKETDADTAVAEIKALAASVVVPYL